MTFEFVLLDPFQPRVVDVRSVHACAVVADTGEAYHRRHLRVRQRNPCRNVGNGLRPRMDRRIERDRFSVATGSPVRSDRHRDRREANPEADLLDLADGSPVFSLDGTPRFAAVIRPPTANVDLRDGHRSLARSVAAQGLISEWARAVVPPSPGAFAFDARRDGGGGCATKTTCSPCRATADDHPAGVWASARAPGTGRTRSWVFADHRYWCSSISPPGPRFIAVACGVHPGVVW